MQNLLWILILHLLDLPQIGEEVVLMLLEAEDRVEVAEAGGVERRP